MITLEKQKYYKVNYAVYTNKKIKEKFLYIDNNKLSKLIAKALNTKNLINVVCLGVAIKQYNLIFCYKSKRIFIEWWDLWKQRTF